MNNRNKMLSCFLALGLLAGCGAFTASIHSNHFHAANAADSVSQKVVDTAPDFSDDFVADCGDEFSLPITLLKAGSLAAIYDTVKTTGSNRFTLQMFARDILVHEDRIIRALNK